MFAVPGWSVSAAAIKDEAAGSGSTSGHQTKGKKRKSVNANTTQAQITNDNVGDLWKRVIERKQEDSSHWADRKGSKHGKAAPADGQKQPSGVTPKKEQLKRKRGGRRQKAPTADSQTRDNGQDAGEHQRDGSDDEARDDGQPKAKKPKKETKHNGSGTAAPPGKSTAPGKKNTNRGQSKDRSQQEAKLPASEREREGKPRTNEQPPNTTVARAPPAAPKLTPLQAAMREKLVSARFRHLNETLYTRPSADAFKLFQDSPEMFSEYHEGFRRQVGVWPENPVDSYIAEICARARVRPPGRGAPASRASGPAPLPRRADGTCTIADLGCGDAALQEALQPARRKLHLDIRSFDLQSPSPLVTRADIADLPLADGSVDVAIFCLALMGTNWVDFVEEAYRALRWKGELWVAEIKSRFAGARRPGAPVVVDHSVGNRKKGSAATAAAKKGRAAAEEAAGAAAEARLAVEVDGAEDRRQDTDVSAFVGVLSRRGFVLRGEPSEAVDMGNKMFVKMYFVKAATPTRGKGVPKDGRGVKPAKKKFIGADEEDGPADESAILKPCVYKLR